MKAASEQEITKLINDGLHVIANPVTQLIIEED
jgi:phenylalanine-4-hydroxylase